MIFESIIGHAHDDDPDVDWVEITYLQTLRRAMRLTAQSGLRVDILLSRGVGLKHGDVIGLYNNKKIAIRVNPVPLLYLRPETISQAMRLSLEMGNLHLPSEVRENMLITLDDGPAIDLAAQLSIAFSRSTARFHPLRCTIVPEIGNDKNGR